MENIQEVCRCSHTNTPSSKTLRFNKMYVVWINLYTRWGARIWRISRISLRKSVTPSRPICIIFSISIKSKVVLNILRITMKSLPVLPCYKFFNIWTTVNINIFSFPFLQLLAHRWKSVNFHKFKNTCRSCRHCSGQVLPCNIRTSTNTCIYLSLLCACVCVSVCLWWTQTSSCNGPDVYI
jgi:hypothetical protein